MKRILRLNTALLLSLGRVLDMTNMELMQVTGIKNATWYRIMGNPDEITVQQLISIANGLTIPVRRFFSHDDNDVVGGKETYRVNPYKPCFYFGKNLLNLVNTQSTATWQDVASELGLSRSNLRNSLLSVTRLPLNRFLTACELFDIDPFCVIVDPNPLHDNPKGREKLLTTTHGLSSIQSYFATIQNELTNFRTEILMARHDIAVLGNKVDAILEDHENFCLPKIALHAATLAQKNAKENQEQAKKTNCE